MKAEDWFRLSLAVGTRFRFVPQTSATSISCSKKKNMRAIVVNDSRLSFSTTNFVYSGLVPYKDRKTSFVSNLS
jgi:hypothetical protein